MKQGSPSTLAEQAYSRIRTDLIAGRLRPETKLPFRELTARYGFGISPLREALARLVSERLVDFAAQRGFYVAPISLEELRDLCSLRIELATKALRLSIERGGDDWESGILVSTHRLVRNPRPGSIENADAFDQWEALHAAFHKSLISACGSPWRLRFLDVLSDQFQRYRRLVVSYKAESVDLWDEVRVQHRAIADAALARDVDTSTDLLTRHFEGSLRQVTELYVATPGPAAPRKKRVAVEKVDVAKEQATRKPSKARA